MDESKGSPESSPDERRPLDRHRLNEAVLSVIEEHIAVLDEQGIILATNRAWDEFARANGARESWRHGVGSSYLLACDASSEEHSQDAIDARITGDGIRDVIAGRRDRFDYEYPCHSATGERFFLLIVRPLLGWDAPGAVVSHIDITRRRLEEMKVERRAADLARATEALRQTNEELDQFAYITSHDLRAPLRGIANLSNWIEEDMGERFTPEAHQQMELLRGRVRRMEAMIDGILEYSRVGRAPAHVESVDVTRILADVTDLLDPPGSFQIDIQPGMPTVQAERLRLHQVFQNLIGNAIKHGDPQTGRVQVGFRDIGTHWEFFVRDNGPGIDPKYHDKIFAIFATLEPRDRREASGIGLAIVRKIVERAGGAVTVESEPGKGATFRFTWPKVQSQGQAVSYLKPMQRSGS